jgi:ABC-type transport system substrate-binding protein
VQATGWRSWIATASAAALLFACTTTPSPSPSAPPTPTAAAFADTISIGLIINSGVPSAIQLSNATAPGDGQGWFIDRFLYRALYRHDAHYAPVPDLAAKPCEVRADGVTIKCGLGDAVFANGDAVRANDVVFTFELAMSDVCGFPTFLYCRSHNLASVKAIDARTVQFTLKEPDARFLTTVLPGVWIDSERVVSDAYKNFRAASEGIGEDAFGSAAKRINEELGKASPDCQSLISSAGQLIADGGLERPARGFFVTGNGFEACNYLRFLRDRLEDMHDAISTDGVNSIAAIYGSLPFQYHPMGNGRWAVKDWEPGDHLTVEAGPGSSAATRRYDFRFFVDRRNALAEEKRGDLDWVSIPGFLGPAQDSGELVRFARQERQLQLVQFPLPDTYTSIQYNERPGQALADPRIREAVARCIDKPAIVEAATDGLGTPARSVVAPGSWAAAADLPEPPRDVPYARSLIKTAGWTQDIDPYYQKGGRPLRIEVLVGESLTQRHFLELARFQLRDCGVDLVVRPVRGVDRIWDYDPMRPIVTLPGDDHPFEAVMVSRTSAADPGLVCDFDSRQIITTESGGCNAGGYSDQRVDGDLAEGRRTYDLSQRAEFYRDMQDVLARTHAALFAWFDTQYDVLAPSMATTSGTIDPTSARWDWQLETIIKAVAP